MTAEIPEDIDRQLLQMLADDGIDLSRAMPIEFMIAAENEENADSIADALEAQGHDVHVYFDDGQSGDPDDVTDPSWKCVCIEEMIPTYEALQEIQAALTKTAEQFGGQLEGWGTFGTASP